LPLSVGPEKKKWAQNSTDWDEFASNVRDIDASDRFWKRELSEWFNFHRVRRSLSGIACHHRKSVRHLTLHETEYSGDFLQHLWIEVVGTDPRYFSVGLLEAGDRH
jgi:hypothetical protein